MRNCWRWVLGTRRRSGSSTTDTRTTCWRSSAERPDGAELAADLTAEVFAAAIVSAGSFRPELGSARAWLFGIARHELAQSWRRGRVEAQARRRLGMEPLVLSDENLERIDRSARRA